jgi:2,3-bisphosphoglycerate-independent phosphoglycerate mutase
VPSVFVLQPRFWRRTAGAAERGAKMLRVHVLTDGRDVEDGTSRNYVSQLQEDLQAITKEHPQVDAKIASGGGRMEVTMDRYEV